MKYCKGCMSNVKSKKILLIITRLISLGSLLKYFEFHNAHFFSIGNKSGLEVLAPGLFYCRAMQLWYGLNVVQPIKNSPDASIQNVAPKPVDIIEH